MTLSIGGLGPLNGKTNTLSNMHKDIKLIYEAYLQEDRARKKRARLSALIAKAVICAAGLGLPGTGCTLQNWKDDLNMLSPLRSRALNFDEIEKENPSMISFDEMEKEKLRQAIQQQALIGTPEQGWKAWIDEQKNNILTRRSSK